MRVLLINPADPRSPNYVIIPNVGLGFLATALRRAGHEVEILDCLRDGLGPDDLPRRLAGRRYDAIGVTLFSALVGVADRYFAVLRGLYPHALLAAGGPHPTFEPADTLRRFPALDLAVIGEGERTLTQLLASGVDRDALDPPRLRVIPGLAFRGAAGVETTAPQWLCDDELTDLPAWDLLQPDRYPLAPNGIFSRGRRVAPVIATRGCPYGCAFCGARKAMGSQVRCRPAARVLDEIELLRRDFGVDEIHFMDDNFSFHADYVRAISEGLLSRGLRMHWACPNGLRLDTLDADLLRLMERSGCYSMAVGIESGSDRVLTALGKRLTVDEIRRRIALIKSVTAIRLTGFFVIGLPFETRAEIEQTIAFACELPLDRANFFNFSPFPGSRLYDELAAAGELAGIDVGRLYIHQVVYAPKSMSPAELARLQRRAHRKFYLRPRVLWGLLHEIRSVTQLRIIVRRAGKLLAG
jgi:radical SAM superfamily enzyme YgiQ (UPF0313 family)